MMIQDFRRAARPQYVFNRAGCIRNRAIEFLFNGLPRDRFEHLGIPRNEDGPGHWGQEPKCSLKPRHRTSLSQDTGHVCTQLCHRWNVLQVLRIDEAGRTIFFAGAGKSPWNVTMKNGIQLRPQRRETGNVTATSQDTAGSCSACRAARLREILTSA